MDPRSVFVLLQVLKFLPLITVKPRFTDTSLLRTVFLLPSPYIFSKLNPLNSGAVARFARLRSTMVE